MACCGPTRMEENDLLLFQYEPIGVQRTDDDDDDDDDADAEDDDDDDDVHDRDDHDG